LEILNGTIIGVLLIIRNITTTTFISIFLQEIIPIRTRGIMAIVAVLEL
jgi:hypothetical protein